MAFDIYGERLIHGHCEVHPWNPMPYPCHQCREVKDAARLLDQQRHKDKEAKRRRYEKEYAGLLWITLLAATQPGAAKE